MQDTKVNNKRIAKNTLLLYIRLILVILVQLYTVPIVLKNLGVSDYGLYNVIGGVVTSFAFISMSLSSGTQRYISFALGKNDKELLDKTFSTIRYIFTVLSVIVFFFIEVIGVWFVNYKMNIPSDRMVAANWVFQFSTISFISSLLYIPYSSAMIAHERMNAYAYMSIVECLAKLGLAISLSYILFDKLIYYSFIILVISLLYALYYFVYCYRKFDEAKKLTFNWNKDIGKGILNYAGWNVIGALSQIGRGQGLNILMNLFFGTIINAAHALATHISAVLNQFITNLYMATRPPITKYYAANDMAGMWNLVFRSAKLAFFLLTLISVPAMVEMESILKLWLKEYPDYTIQIVNILISIILVETLVNQLVSALQAANKVKRCQRDCGFIILMCLPVSYVVLKFNNNVPLVPYLVSLILSVVYVVYLIYLAKKEIDMNVTSYVKTVLLKDVLVFTITFSITFAVSRCLDATINRILITVLLSVTLASFLIWTIGLDSAERSLVKKIIKKRIKQ